MGLVGVIITNKKGAVRIITFTFLEFFITLALLNDAFLYKICRFICNLKT